MIEREKEILRKYSDWAHLSDEKRPNSLDPLNEKYEYCNSCSQDGCSGCGGCSGP